jgi:hypothetical protein
MSEMTSPAPAPDWLGQGTAVEMARAVAQVQGQVWAARTNPRSLSKARALMHEICAMPSLAERAFWSFPRGGETLTGLTVILARELARCWQNIDYGIVELRRDDAGGMSEMKAYAWDLEANTMVSSVFLVPTVVMTRNGAKTLTDPRDIYELNTNNAQRRVRECIFAVLSPAFVEEARERCLATLAAGDKGKSLEERRAGAVAAFDGMGVPQRRLEQRLGKPLAKWTVYDVIELRTAHKTIERGERLVEDEFPAVAVSSAEIVEQHAALAAAAGSGDPGAPREYAPDDPERPFE